MRKFKEVIKSLVLIFLIISCNNDYQNKNNQINNDNVVISDPVVKMPDVLNKPEIKYPEILRNYNKDVRIYVSARIDTNGNVHNVRVVKSTNSEFDKYAIEYAYKYLFVPGEKDGKKVEMNVSWPIDFKSSNE